MLDSDINHLSFRSHHINDVGLYLLHLMRQNNMFRGQFPPPGSHIIEIAVNLILFLTTTRTVNKEVGGHTEQQLTHGRGQQNCFAFEKIQEGIL